MKKFTLALSLCVLLTSLTFAQNGVGPYLATDVPTTTISFEETEYDYGEIEAGEKVLNVYTFTNTGDEPLILSEAKGSCGCTVPAWPNAPIAPGESGEIVVVFDSKGKKNKQSKRVTITANTTPAQSFLTIKGTVIPAEKVSDDEKETQETNASAKEEIETTVGLTDIVLFPNPTKEQLHIKLENLLGKSVSIGIFSDTGQRLVTKEISEISEETVKIDVGHLAGGTYLASVLIEEKERLTKQFAIVH